MIKKLLSHAIFLALTITNGASSPNLVAQENQRSSGVTPRVAWIDELLQHPEEHGVLGSVCGVVRQNEIIHLGGYGVENREQRKPVNPQSTRFYLASVTKLYTATLIMRLVDQGLLDLDEDISTYFKTGPQLLLLPDSKPVTLRHLLTHTAGFDDRNIGMAAESSDRVKSLNEYLSTALAPQIRPAGEITMYDNHGWALAGLISEQVTGKSYPDLLKNEVLLPLNMASSANSNSVFSSGNADLAEAYVTRYENNEIVWKKIKPAFRQTLPAGGICSTASDAMKLIQMHLNLGMVEDARYLSLAAATEMQTQAWTSREGAEGLTPGFWETKFNGHRMLMIVGDASEGASVIAMLPDRQLGIFLAGSRKDSTYLLEKLKQMLDRLAPGKPPSIEDSPRPGWDERKQRIEGEYYILRFSQRSLESLAKWQAWIRVQVTGPGRIVVVDSLDETREYHEVADYVFRHKDQPGYISFKSSTDGTKDWATTTDGLGFPRGLGFANSFQKAAWFERINVKRPVLLCGLMVFALAVSVWPIIRCIYWVLLRFTRRGREKKTGGAGALSRWVIGFTAGCGLAGALGVAALLANTDQLLFGLPGWGKIPLGLLWVFVFLTPVCVWQAIAAWRYKRWSLLERVFVSVVVTAFVIWVPFLWQWSLIRL